ncbi:MAG: AbiJ-NTD4 domain-containing protein [Candidatus Helarchaeota archaeon]
MKRTFSERMGLKPCNVLQFESMDESLRNTLWNSIYSHVFIPYLKFTHHQPRDYRSRLIILIWTDHYKLRFDEIPGYSLDCFLKIKELFFESQWNEVYDFIEFLLEHSLSELSLRGFSSEINQILESELSGYRIISNKIVRITSNQEIESIESAVEIHTTINHHLKNSLRLLSNRTKPDYSNSIKESILAVEALARLIVGNKNVTLGSALKEIERTEKVDFHKALSEGYSKLYGWTSDDEGIRHSLMDEPSLSQEDALYMLVSCSAFINYLFEKTNKAGLDLSKN